MLRAHHLEILSPLIFKPVLCERGLRGQRSNLGTWSSACAMSHLSLPLIAASYPFLGEGSQLFAPHPLAPQVHWASLSVLLPPG